MTGKPIKDTHYIYPPRTKTAIPRADTSIFADLNWHAQYKYNDTHCLIKKRKDHTIELWDRHGNKIRNYTPDDNMKEQLNELFTRLKTTDWCLLDGGIIDSKHVAMKNIIVIWDILVLNGEHLLGSTYGSRLTNLTLMGTDFLLGNKPFYYESKHHDKVDFGFKVSENIFIPRSYPREEWDMMWETVEMVNKPYTRNGEIKPLIEGIVMKDLNGTLEMGFKQDNNSSWMAKSRVVTGRHNF